ncbi:MAG: SDR family NAD(P)-dependent oxidoreductase [Bacteroidia bacterium]|nr:SDR family NAD(P)-dependent oxidoreductase [Bacteroidia bacterium]
MDLKQKYGPLALVAGASIGMGAAFSHYLAEAGMDLVLVARRIGPLEELAETLRQRHGVQVDCIACDLALPDAASQLLAALDNRQVSVFVYNAALSYIGRFEEHDPTHLEQLSQANMVTPLLLVQKLGQAMLARGKGAIILLASLAGLQGSGFLTAYAASKSFDRVLAESLWYEWKDRGVDVLGCTAGATSTPNFIDTQPEKTGLIRPSIQTPEAVVKECFRNLGKRPSFISGAPNRLASFIMQRILPRKMAIKIMGDTTRKMYRL